jgi:L-lactate dehydrogenase complex protein LldE
VVPFDAACCGQPPANAGFEQQASPTLERFVRTFEPFDRVVVLSGSCALHVKTHAAQLHAAHLHAAQLSPAAGTRVAASTTEFCTFLHDEVGLDAVAALGARFTKRVGMHIGCHGLRGLGLAKSSELQGPPFNKVQALLETVDGLSFAPLSRPDECCGFGGTFSVAEPAISEKMGRDRLRDYADARADAIVSTDLSCLMHLGGLSTAAGGRLPMLHVAEVLAGHAE